ncbi:hypothetical protein ZEAMMB73_Zm00001d008611 [Zea mays]|uniref:Uncharacterized protein n=1 Tax=Zea mays TaxID=4577 RepID=A0A1D6FE72_MAIZE|nr:hypothetical protein ZEAMMB73_Zm00001d008611 [Zea mays]
MRALPYLKKAYGNAMQKAILVNRKLRSQNYQNLEDRQNCGVPRGGQDTLSRLA